MKHKFGPIETLLIDYGQSLQEMISAGQYDQVNDVFREDAFKVEGEGIQEFECQTIEDVRDFERESDPSNPWIVARIEHLLAYGAKFPKDQMECAIIATGAKADRGGWSCIMAHLDSDDSRSKRRLEVRNNGDGWCLSGYILRVRPKKP